MCVWAGVGFCVGVSSMGGLQGVYFEFPPKSDKKYCFVLKILVTDNSLVSIILTPRSIVIMRYVKL